jgi:hypothetical protein
MPPYAQDSLKLCFQRFADFINGPNSDACPVVGVHRGHIVSVKAQTLIVHNFGEGDCDGMHSLKVSEEVASLMPFAKLVHDTEMMWLQAIQTFLNEMLMLSRE